MNISDFQNPTHFQNPTKSIQGSVLETQNEKHKTRNIDTPEEAAKTFEKVLIEQFVSVMTEQLFKANLSGEDGPGWMKAQGDTQRRVLTEILSDHLVENGTFNISSTLMDQWQRNTPATGDE